MKFVIFSLLFSSFAFANDALEKTYEGFTDKGESCTMTLKDSQGSASFTYLDGGERKTCVLSYDRYTLTNARDDGRTFATVKDTSGLKSCKVQVHFKGEELKRLRMGIKSIFSVFHSYVDCNPLPPKP